MIAAISRTGAMFFGDLVAAFTNIGRALRSDGRVALLSWPNAGTNIYSMGAPNVLRLYLADVMYGGKRHLLSVRQSRSLLPGKRLGG